MNTLSFRLCKAAVYGNLDLAKALLADPHCNPNESTPWKVSATPSPFFHLEADLVKDGVVDEEDYDAKPLHLAVLAGQVEMVGLLVDAGADVNELDGRGRYVVYMRFVCVSRSPLMCAIFGLDTLRATEANLTYLALEHPSHLTILRNHLLPHPRLSRTALSDPEEAVLGLNLLCLSAYLDKLECLELLLNIGRVDPDARDASEATALMYAARDGHVEIVEALLDRGASPLLQDRNGFSVFQHGQDFPQILEMCQQTLDKMQHKEVPVSPTPVHAHSSKMADHSRDSLSMPPLSPRTSGMDNNDSQGEMSRTKIDIFDMRTPEPDDRLVDMSKAERAEKTASQVLYDAFPEPPPAAVIQLPPPVPAGNPPTAPPPTLSWVPPPPSIDPAMIRASILSNSSILSEPPTKTSPPSAPPPKLRPHSYESPPSPKSSALATGRAGAMAAYFAHNRTASSPLSREVVSDTHVHDLSYDMSFDAAEALRMSSRLDTGSGNILDDSEEVATQVDKLYAKVSELEAELEVYRSQPIKPMNDDANDSTSSEHNRASMLSSDSESQSVLAKELQLDILRADLREIDLDFQHTQTRCAAVGREAKDAHDLYRQITTNPQAEVSERTAAEARWKSLVKRHVQLKKEQDRLSRDRKEAIRQIREAVLEIRKKHPARPLDWLLEEINESEVALKERQVTLEKQAMGVVNKRPESMMSLESVLTSGSFEAMYNESAKDTRIRTLEKQVESVREEAKIRTERVEQELQDAGVMQQKLFQELSAVHTLATSLRAELKSAQDEAINWREHSRQVLQWRELEVDKARDVGQTWQIELADGKRISIGDAEIEEEDDEDEEDDEEDRRSIAASEDGERQVERLYQKHTNMHHRIMKALEKAYWQREHVTEQLDVYARELASQKERNQKLIRVVLEQVKEKLMRDDSELGVDAVFDEAKQMASRWAGSPDKMMRNKRTSNLTDTSNDTRSSVPMHRNASNSTASNSVSSSRKGQLPRRADLHPQDMQSIEYTLEEEARVNRQRRESDDWNRSPLAANRTAAMSPNNRYVKKRHDSNATSDSFLTADDSVARRSMESGKLSNATYETTTSHVDTFPETPVEHVVSPSVSIQDLQDKRQSEMSTSTYSSVPKSLSLRIRAESIGDSDYSDMPLSPGMSSMRSGASTPESSRIHQLRASSRKRSNSQIWAAAMSRRLADPTISETMSQLTKLKAEMGVLERSLVMQLKQEKTVTEDDSAGTKGRKEIVSKARQVLAKKREEYIQRMNSLSELVGLVGSEA